MTNPSALVSRWNATYPPGTPVTVAFSPPLETATADSAYEDTGEAWVPVDGRNEIIHRVPLSNVEHRPVVSPATEQSLRALGVPPISELDPEPLFNLRDIPRNRWPEFEHRWFVIPHAIAGYIARLEAPPTEDQTEHIERHIAEFHGLPPILWCGGSAWLAPGKHSQTKMDALRRLSKSTLTLEKLCDVFETPVESAAAEQFSAACAECASPLDLLNPRHFGIHPRNAEWWVQFSFAHRFITGTAQLLRL